jgi:hypothetical protein
MSTDTDTTPAPEQPEWPPYTPEMIALGGGWTAHWLISFESGMDPDNYHAGWGDVWAMARTGRVEIAHLDEEELTPVEARNLAHALLAAADHAERYPLIVAQVLGEEQSEGWIDQQGLPLETVRPINEWINKRVNRALKVHNTRGK